MPGEVSKAEVFEMASTPSGYCQLALRQRLYDWQAAVMDSLDAPRTRTAVRTCNESGKTSVVIAGLVLWHMGTFPRSLTVTTSATARQVWDQLYPRLETLGEQLNRAGGRKEWEFHRGRGVNHATGSRLVSFTTDRPGRAEGWHDQEFPESAMPDENLLAGCGVGEDEWRAISEEARKAPLLIIVDEAKSVQDEIFHAFERCRPTRLLMASSPGDPQGYFYDAFHGQSGRWQRYHVSYTDCPHLYDNPARRREIEEQIGSLPDDLVQSMVYGNFGHGGENGLFDAHWIDQAMGATNPRWGRGTLRAALDLSAGRDEQVLMIRDGNEATYGGIWHETDDRRFAGLVIDELRRRGFRQADAASVKADDGGLGRVMLNEFDRLGWPFSRVLFGDPAREPRYYGNRRAEMYARLADRLRRREIRLPLDPELKEQLLWQKYRAADGVLRLVPKERLPRSPDRADATAMLFDDLPAVMQAEIEERRVVRVSRTGEVEVGNEGLSTSLY